MKHSLDSHKKFETLSNCPLQKFSFLNYPAESYMLKVHEKKCNMVKVKYNHIIKRAVNACFKQIYGQSMSCSEKKSGESRGTLTHLKSALNATFYCKFLRPLLLQKQPSKVFFKKVFLKISQYSRENTCVGVTFHTVAGLQAYNIIKKRLQHRCFPKSVFKNIYFEEYLRTTASVVRTATNG